jgi:hypothetical protein
MGRLVRVWVRVRLEVSIRLVRVTLGFDSRLVRDGLGLDTRSVRVRVRHQIG